MTQPNVDAIQQAEQVVTSAQRQTDLDDVCEAIKQCADDIRDVSTLSEEYARFIAYYCASTYLLDRKTVNPPLTINGATGTGKTQTAKIARRYTCKTGSVSAKEQTLPTVRDAIDELIQKGCATIFIEEMDRCKHNAALEEFVFQAYDKETADGAIKRKDRNDCWETHHINNYVSYVTHRREDYKDAANMNRGLEVRTTLSEGIRLKMADEVPKHKHRLDKVANLALPKLTRPEKTEGRTWHNWELMLKIATATGDKDWVKWAEEQIMADSQMMKDTREFDPQQAVFWAIVSALEKSQTKDKYKSIAVSRVVDHCKRESSLIVSNHQAVREVRRMGLECKRSGGPWKVFPTKESLDKAAKRLGAGDWESDDDAPGSV